MGVSNILYLGVKELRSLARDPIMLVMIVYAFTIGIYTAATAMPETLNKATIAIVDEDRSPLSQRIADAFRPPHFGWPDFTTLSEMDDRMDAGRDTFALDIPPGFQRDVLAGRRPTIQLNVDATRMSQAFVGSGHVQAIIGEEIQGFVQRYREDRPLPVDIVLRARFNPQLQKSWFGSIMEVINNVTMLSIVLAGAALIREREHGTIEHLLSMPVTPFEIMMSKVWAVGLVVLGASTFALSVIVEGLLSVPVEGSLVLFIAGTALYLFATASMGIFLGTIARTMPQFALLLILVLLPLQMLSGGVTPRESMPALVQHVMLAAPTTHFVQFAQAILYRGAGPDVVWPHLIGIILIGAALFSIALVRFRRAGLKVE